MTTPHNFAQRQSFVADPHRPRFHYLPPANWMNDPNGVIQWHGEYHLFYQYNPNSATHENMHWGHAVSRDLVHWEDLPIALGPTINSVDEGGIFSGCAVDNDGQPVIFYTGVRGANYSQQVQCMAMGSPDMLRWEKYPDNPIVGTVPAEAGQTADFRDPFVWKHGDDWLMLVGSKIEGVGGTVFLYQSNNLRDWEYLNPIYTGDALTHGPMWECPNLFQLGDKWVLMISSHNGTDTDHVIYFVGEFDGRHFTPHSEGVIDHAYLYAPLTLENTEGQRIMFGWVREGRNAAAFRAAGWAGVQSIPRVLSLDTENRLCMQPIAAIENIRGEATTYVDLPLSDEMTLDVRGLSLDIETEIELSEGGEITISLACSADGAERTEIIYADGQLRVNRQDSSTDPANEHHPHTANHQLVAGEPLQLRILLDGSILEIIANARTSITSRIYPTQQHHNHIRLSGSRGIVRAMTCYEMPSIWQLSQ